MRKNILLFGHSYATQFIDISNQYTQLFDKNKYNVTVAYLVGEPDEAIKQKHTAENVIFLNTIFLLVTHITMSLKSGLKSYLNKQSLSLLTLQSMVTI